MTIKVHAMSLKKRACLWWYTVALPGTIAFGTRKLIAEECVGLLPHSAAEALASDLDRFFAPQCQGRIKRLPFFSIRLILRKSEQLNRLRPLNFYLCSGQRTDFKLSECLSLHMSWRPQPKPTWGHRYSFVKWQLTTTLTSVSTLRLARAAYIQKTRPANKIWKRSLGIQTAVRVCFTHDDMMIHVNQCSVW